MGNKEWTHTLAFPVTMPDGTVVTELKFPRMKGKWMRKFKVQAGGHAEIEYGVLMGLGERMLAGTLGEVSAGYIFDEMEPDDVNEVCGILGERFAGGQKTGETA